ncbi:unnamed protein product, partial [Ectocarpus sp. 4 AP-2014]
SLRLRGDGEKRFSYTSITSFEGVGLRFALQDWLLLLKCTTDRFLLALNLRNVVLYFPPRVAIRRFSDNSCVIPAYVSLLCLCLCLCLLSLCLSLLPFPLHPVAAAAG